MRGNENANSIDYSSVHFYDMKFDPYHYLFLLTLAALPYHNGGMKA